MVFIDIHTHQKTDSHSLEIINVGLAVDINSEIFYSVGIHPWEIKSDKLAIYREQLLSIMRNRQVLMIGETGMDKYAEVSLDIQKEVFMMHVHLSEELKKPLILHCVRCFNEIISLKKELKPQMPWIVHGFNNKVDIAEQLLTHGILLSFGKALLHEDSNASQVLKNRVSDLFFLETDDSGVSIETVYEKAAKCINKEVAELCEIQQKQFEKLFEKAIIQYVFKNRITRW